MIVLAAASIMYLTGLQAAIDGPRQAFWACAKAQKSKAQDQKIAADAFETYLRNACSNELQSLKSAITAVDVKNGMGHKAATDDASSSLDDYVSAPVEKYRDAVALNGSPASTATPAATPASDPKPASSQPPRP
jgi:hypothetical protein